MKPTVRRGLKGRKRGENDRRKKRRFGSDGDDSDEEYEAWKDEDAVDDTDDDDEVLELDASEDCSDVEADEEESFDSSGCDDYEEDEDFLVVENLEKKKKKRRKEKGYMGQRRKEDGNFEVSEFDMEEEDEGGDLVRGKRKGKPQVRRRFKISDSEYELEEEEDDDDDEEYDDDFSPEDEVEEDERVVVRSKKKSVPQRRVVKTKRRKQKHKSSKLRKNKKTKSCKKPGRKRKRRVKSDIDVDDDDDDDFLVEENCYEMNVNRKRRKVKLDEDELDDDFLVEENCYEMNVNRKRRKVKLDEDELDDDFLVEDNTLHVDASRTRRRRIVNCVVDEDEDDNDFFVEDSILEVNNHRKSRRRVKCSMEDEENDDDFVLQDSTLLVDRNMVTKKGKRLNRFRMAVPMVCGNSVPSDFEYALSKDEAMNLIVVDDFMNRDQDFVAVERNIKDKGKEKEKGKEIIDLNKNICGICLSKERKGVYRGFLDSCAHYFCFTCIMTWSKVESRCPMCKQRFTTISKSLGPKVGFGMRALVIRIPERDQVYQPSEEELIGYLNPYENIVCTECLQGGDDNLMLLCDLCDSPSHTYCVGLGRHVPEGNWYCDACRCADERESNLTVQNSSMDQVLQCDDLLQQQFSERSEAGVLYGHVSSLRTPQQSVTLYGDQSQDPHLSSCTGYSLMENNGAGSQPSESIGSTLLRRRSIHQRIRIILSGNRLRTLPVRPTVDITTSGSLTIDLNSSPR